MMYLLCNQKKIEIEDCITFWSRLKGFMFQKKKIDKGKRFPHCNSIHTFFMFQEIDVIMTDQNNRIVKMYSNLKPMRILLPHKKVMDTYEFPVGICKYYSIHDELKVKESKK